MEGPMAEAAWELEIMQRQRSESTGGVFMSSKARSRARRAAEREADWADMDAEEARVDALSLFERIEECQDIDDVKRVLHLIREKLETEE